MEYSSPLEALEFVQFYWPDPADIYVLFIGKETGYSVIKRTSAFFIYAFNPPNPVRRE